MFGSLLHARLPSFSACVGISCELLEWTSYSLQKCSDKYPYVRTRLGHSALTAWIDVGNL